jgi:hypothetical protein
MANPAGALSLPALDLTPLDRAIARMASELDEHTRRDDGRQIFLFAYHFLSTQMRRNVLDGRFADPRWMIALAGRFADVYFEASDAFERGAACPEPWASRRSIRSRISSPRGTRRGSGSSTRRWGAWTSG